MYEIIQVNLRNYHINSSSKNIKILWIKGNSSYEFSNMVDNLVESTVFTGITLDYQLNAREINIYLFIYIF